MKEITISEANQKFGIRTVHHEMTNGEARFRLIDEDGIGYVRTQASDIGSWQNSHFHRTHFETYIVQEKWIVIATLSKQKEVELLKLEEGDVWTSASGVAHNVFMSSGAITHTVKHGAGTKDDWETNQTTKLLDQRTKELSEGFLSQLRSLSET